MAARLMHLLRKWDVPLIATLTTIIAILGSAPQLEAQSLRGGRSSLDRQAREAIRHDFTYLADADQLRRFIEAGLLVRVQGNGDYLLQAVSFPWARPEVRIFIRRLASQYHAACGERLFVTSLTRPRANQPHNASNRSVHPTGMALDLRRPNNGRCRDWLEDVLLDLEGQAVLEATVERSPPHYHVAIFPRQYAAYVERLSGRPAKSLDISTYTVRRRDTLWRISQRFGTSAAALQRENDLLDTTIYPGQVLKIPGDG